MPAFVRAIFIQEFDESRTFLESQETAALKIKAAAP